MLNLFVYSWLKRRDLDGISLEDINMVGPNKIKKQELESQRVLDIKTNAKTKDGGKEFFTTLAKT